MSRSKLDKQITREVAVSNAAAKACGKPAEYYAGRDAYIAGEPCHCSYIEPPGRLDWYHGYVEARTRERLKAKGVSV